MLSIFLLSVRLLVHCTTAYTLIIPSLSTATAYTILTLVMENLCIFRAPISSVSKNRDLYRAECVRLGAYRDISSVGNEANVRMDRLRDEICVRINLASKCDVYKYFSANNIVLTKFYDELEKCWMDEEYASLIVLDCVIELVFILVISRVGEYSLKDMISREHMRRIMVERSIIVRDLYILENQLPLVMLMMIGNDVLCVAESKIYMSISEYTKFFCLFDVNDEDSRCVVDSTNVDEIKHILGLQYEYAVSCLRNKHKAGGMIDYHDMQIPSMTQLASQGIKVVGSAKCIRDIRYDTATRTIHLPVVVIDENTDVKIANLLAYETCVGRYAYIAQYVFMMKSLIKSHEDSDMMLRFKVMRDMTGDTDYITHMWSRLYKDLPSDRAMDEWVLQMKALRDAYDDRYTKCTNESRWEYCSRTWIVLSVIVAIIAATAAIVQTIYHNTLL